MAEPIESWTPTDSGSTTTATSATDAAAMSEAHSFAPPMADVQVSGHGSGGEPR